MDKAKRIYLIANNPNLSEQKIERINSMYSINKGDLIVRFNVPCSNTLKLFDGKTTDFIPRMKTGGFHGVRGTRIICNEIRGNDNINLRFLVWRNGVEINKTLMSKIANDNSLHYEEDNNIIIESDDTQLTGSSPSSGFITIIKFLESYPDSQVCLIGFNFKNSQNDACHNFSKEKKYVDKLIAAGRVELIE